VSALLAVDDVVEIQALVHRYADAVVHRDASQWGRCWADDARWNLGRGRLVEGRPAIVEFWLSSMKEFSAIFQTVQNGVAWPTGEGRAAGRWYIGERFCEAAGTRGILLGHYDDEYSRGDDGWQFASRVLQVHYRGAPDLSGEFNNTAEALRARGVAADV
jgi:SnoaL-like protein